MKILALTIRGREFMYNPKTAHKVSSNSAETICQIVNRYKFMYNDNPGCTWHIYEVDKYDTAYTYAQYQDFTIRKGVVKARTF